MSRPGLIAKIRELKYELRRPGLNPAELPRFQQEYDALVSQACQECQCSKAELLRTLAPDFEYYRRSPKGAVVNPYDTLPALPFGNPDEEETEQVVTEGAGAMRAYQEMLYGVSRNNEVLKEQWRRLLLQYCELDTAAMVMVWTHWMK